MTYSLVDEMDFVRDLCSSIHAARKEVGIPTNQPLSFVTLFKESELFDFMLEPYKGIIADECNVKQVDWELAFIPEDYRYFNIFTEYKLDFKAAGKLYGKNTQEIGRLVKEGKVDFGDEVSLVGDYVVPNSLISYNRTVKNEDNVESLGKYVGLVGEKSFFVLSTVITKELRLEKLANGLTKLINSERRTRGFDITDTVDATLQVPEEYSDLTDDMWDEVAKNAKCGRIFSELDYGELKITFMERSR